MYYVPGRWRHFTRSWNPRPLLPNPLFIHLPFTVTFIHQVKVQDNQFIRNANYKFHEDSCYLGYDAAFNGKHRHFEEIASSIVMAQAIKEYYMDPEHGGRKTF
jgi:hypothetical protein